APSGGYAAGGVDQLDISPQADFVAQARDLPEIREDRVAAPKAQLQNGTYDTADKLDAALSGLLDEIAYRGPGVSPALERPIAWSLPRAASSSNWRTNPCTGSR